MRTLKLFATQPGGVYLMFSTEFWERFSYYGFMGVLVFFMTDQPSHGGLGWSRGDSLLLFGIVTGCIWMTPVAGGWIADRLIGARRAVMMGCAGLAAGNLMLATAAFSVANDAGSTGLAVPLFYGGLIALVLGAGMFKSNASALLSEAFEPEDPRREAGFTLFYMGINLGAMVAPFGAGTLGELAGWGFGFLVAGIGMLIGLVIFVWLSPRFFRRACRGLLTEAVVAGRGGLLRDPEVRLILLMALFATVFMSGLMQYGGLLNLYAATAVDRHVLGAEIPATWFLALNPLLVILLGPLMVAFWTSRTRTKREPFVAKIAIGLCCMAAAFALLSVTELSRGSALAGIWVLPLFYLILTAGELCVLPAGLMEISRRAPRHATGLLMGIWILSMGVGSVLAGWIGSLTETFSHATVFGSLAFVAAGSALVLAVLEPHVRCWFAVRGTSPNRGLSSLT